MLNSVGIDRVVEVMQIARIKPSAECSEKIGYVLT